MPEQTMSSGMSAEEKLRSMLEQDFQNNCLVFSRAGFINRRHYGRHTGCSNTQYYKKLFLEYEEKSGRSKTKTLLLALLSQDHANGTLKFSRGGKVDRTHYAARLGVTKAALAPHIPVLASFEEKVGGAKRFRDDDLSRMEGWLDHHLRAGTLRIRPGGGLVRAQFKAAFKITYSDFETRFPEVGALIARFDALAHSGAVRHLPLPSDRKDLLNSPHRSPEAHPNVPISKPHISHFEDNLDEPAPSFNPVPWSPGDFVEAIAGALARDRSIGRIRRNPRGGIDYVFYLAHAVAAIRDTAASVAGPPSPKIESPSSVSDLGSSGDGQSIPNAALVVGERIPPIPTAHEAAAADPPDMLYPMAIAVVRRTATDISTSVDEKAERAQHPCSEPASAAPLAMHSALRKHQHYERGSRRHRLVEALNDHFDRGGTLPIHRRSLWDTLGVSEVEVTRAERVIVKDYEAASAAHSVKVEFGGSASAIVAMYPELEKHQHYEHGSTESLLIQILNNDLLGGGIPRSRGGKIDRRRLTRMFDFSITAMTYYIDILRDYETATGGLQNSVDARVPEIEAWLARSMADGTLQIRDGKVERKSLAVRFDLSRNKTVFSRNPRLLALVEKYDAIIAETGYLPSSLKQEVEQVRIAIANRAPLYSTGLSYDRTALASITGISIGRITRSPFIEVIADADRELVSSLERDPLCNIFTGRLFSFRELRDLGWSEAFLTRLSASFLKAFKTSKKDVAKSAFLALMELLRFLATSTNPDCRAVTAGLNTGRITAVEQKLWTRATKGYADSVNERMDLSGAAADTKLKAVNKVIRHLANDRTFPELDLPLKATGGSSQHRRTIAQPSAAHGVDDYLAFATLMLDEGSRLRGIEVEKEAEAGFLKSLRGELASREPKADDTPATVILQVLKRRLELTEDAVAAVYMRWRAHWERGQTLIAAGRDFGEEWKDRLVPGAGNEGRRRSLMREAFPLDNPELALANLTRLISDRFGGIYPKTDRILGQFFAKRALEFGGKHNIEAFVTPHRDAVGAILLLYLIESGANVAVGRSLFIDAMESSEISGCVHVTGQKARAQGKPIHAHLDNKSHAARGMEWLLYAGAELRSALGTDNARLLFVANFQSGRKLIEEWAVRDLLKKIVAGIPELANLDLTPSMLRPTILLIAALEGGASARVAAGLGQHGLNVGQGYTDHPPTRFMRDGEMRAFMDAWEVLTVYVEDDAQALLGYSKDVLEKKVSDLRETGLGTLCRDLHGRPGSNGAACTQLDCWNNCPQLVVIARTNDLALMIIWRASLLEAQAAWVRDRPERWYFVWYPWLLFIDTVERKILATTMARIWRQALALADQVMAHPNFRHRSPY